MNFLQRKTAERKELGHEKHPDRDNQGNDYQLNLAALFAIRLVLDADIQDILLTTNSDVFSDVKVRVQYKDGSIKLYLVSVKHKNKLQNAVDFDDNDFSLEKYKESYHKDVIPRTLQGGPDDLFKDVKLEDVVCCLFTNLPLLSDSITNITVDKNASLFCEVVQDSGIDFISTTTSGYHVFRIKAEQTEVACSLLTHQKENIKNVEKIEGEFQDKSGSKIHSIDLKTFNPTQLVEQQREEYSEFFRNFRFYEGQLNCKQVLEAITLRIQESFGESQADVGANFVKYIEDCFLSNHRLCLRQIKTKLLELMTLSMEDLEERFQVFREVTDLNKPEQKLMVSKHIKVSLQGREAVGLCDLVDSDFCQRLAPEFLLKHMDDVVHVGKPLEFKCENYIKRRFKKIFLKTDVLWHCESYVLIVSVSDKNDLRDYICNWKHVIDLTEGNDLPANFSRGTKAYVLLISNNDERAEALLKSTIAKADRVHYLKFHKLEKPFLEWMGSSDKDFHLGNYLRKHISESHCESFGEEELLEYFRSTLNVISADPGMGKSTLIDSLIRYCPSSKWVFKLSLDECYDDLKQENPEDPLQYIYEKCEDGCGSTFSRDLFTYMKSRDAVTVFIDAFDEIPKDYKVLPFIGELKKQGARIFVFTRPSLQDSLERKFNTMAIEMVPLQKDEIRDYLLKRNTDALSEDVLHKIEGFVKTPLHLSMFATVLSNGDPNWDQSDFQVTDLYEAYITTKCSFYHKSKQLVRKHESLALLSIFGKDFLSRHATIEFLKIKWYLLNIREDVVGLISGVHRFTPVFSHKSLAEYLAAKWLSSNTKHRAFKKMYTRTFKKKHRNMRFFFDKIVTRECPLHAAVVDGNLGLVRRLCHQTGLPLRDSLKRTPLHLAVGCFENDIFNFYVLQARGINETVCEIINEICSRLESFATQTDFLGWDWQDYIALKTGEYHVVNAICYWECKPLMVMHLSRVQREKKFRSYFMTMAIMQALQNGSFDFLKLIIEQEYKEASIEMGESKSLDFPGFIKSRAKFALSRSVGEFDEKKHGKLVDVLMFFIVNEEPFNAKVLLDFVEEVGYFEDIEPQIYVYDGVTEQICDIMKFKLFRYCRENLESLEEHFGLADAKEKLNVLERQDVITEMIFCGYTPLCAAVITGRLNVVQVMADISGVVNAKPGDKYVPLHCAIDVMNVNVVAWLIKAGADVNQVDSDGNSALSYTLKALSRPSSISMRSYKFKSDFSSEAPLNIVKLLIDAGTDPTIKNSEGLSCYDLAAQINDCKIKELFKCETKQ